LASKSASEILIINALMHFLEGTAQFFALFFCGQTSLMRGIFFMSKEKAKKAPQKSLKEKRKEKKQKKNEKGVSSL